MRNSRTLETEVERSQIQNQSGLYSKTLYQKKKKMILMMLVVVMKFIKELPSKRHMKTQNATGVRKQKVHLGW